MKNRVVRHEVVQPQDQSIKFIPLTKGKVAIVDAVDYGWLMQWNWYAFEIKRKSESLFYVVRSGSVNHRKRMVFMHRELTGENSEETDHRNHDTLDNRRSNLRPCTRSQNQANRLAQRSNTSGFKGVSWASQNKKWQAQTSVKGSHVHLGHYDTKEEAYEVYRAYRKSIHPEFHAD